jgi:hypothetical protein
MGGVFFFFMCNIRLLEFQKIRWDFILFFLENQLWFLFNYCIIINNIETFLFRSQNRFHTCYVIRA